MHPTHITAHLAEATRPINPDATPDIHPEIARLNWNYDPYHNALRPILPRVQEFVSAIIRKEPPRWLSLLGPSGVGKTHILKQAMSALRAAHSRGAWSIKTSTGWRGPQMAHIIPAEDLSDWKAPKDYARYDVIYIEDIGSGALMDKGAGGVITSRIKELLQLRSGKWTMLCANLYRGEIETAMDGRIASRLKRDGSTCIEIPADVPDFWG
ncbi:hypothetical protein WJU23_05315 [Prosthecobacter sp. SYSU 5D2]|uniref:hypothetical protein n=1 Tax=Prosthecobacter sp. SYSU 5D2 TaxID=3134134 RepID=UPI0031FE9873